MTALEDSGIEAWLRDELRKLRIIDGFAATQSLAPDDVRILKESAVRNLH